MHLNSLLLNLHVYDLCIFLHIDTEYWGHCVQIRNIYLIMPALSNLRRVKYVDDHSVCLRLRGKNVAVTVQAK